MSKQRTIMLTGGRGMVGSNVRERLAGSDWNLLAPSHSDLDLLDAEAVHDYLAVYRPDIIIHSAGLVGGIQANIANPVAFLDKNLVIGRNVIMAAYEAKIEQLINLASTCVYPRSALNPLSEDMILTGELEPTNEGYAIAKLMALRLCQYVNRERGKSCFKTIIPCNLYGRHDKFDPARSHLIPAIIHKVHHAKLNGSKVVDIWGDGTARREFMYAGDLADFLYRALNNFDTLPDLTNVGLGHDFSINDYYAAVAEVVGWTGEFSHDLSKPVGMKQKLASDAKQAAWGWAPKTSLKDGIQKTYDFYLETLNK
jgi:GDP-L-fucose synthase